MGLLNSFDDYVYRYVNAVPDRFQPFLSALSYITHPYVWIFLLGAGTLTMLIIGNKYLWALFGVYLLLLPLGGTLKRLFKRDRPSIHRKKFSFEVGRYGFPSAHAYATGLMLVAWIIMCSMYLEGALLYSLVLLGLIGVVVIGVSRVYGGVHHASDIVAGWFFGTLIGAIAASTISYVMQL